MYVSTHVSKTEPQHQQENATTARRFHMEIFRKRKFAVADEILAPDFVLRNPMLSSEFTHGPAGVKKFALVVADSAPEYEIIHHDTISNKDMVLIRWTFSGILKKELLCIPSSEKPVTITGFDLFRIGANGKIAEMWQQFNVGNWQ